MGAAQNGLFFVQVGPKKTIYRDFTNFFSELKLLISVKSSNIFH